METLTGAIPCLARPPPLCAGDLMARHGRGLVARRECRGAALGRLPFDIARPLPARPGQLPRVPTLRIPQRARGAPRQLRSLSLRGGPRAARRPSWLRRERAAHGRAARARRAHLRRGSVRARRRRTWRMAAVADARSGHVPRRRQLGPSDAAVLGLARARSGRHASPAAARMARGRYRRRGGRRGARRARQWLLARQAALLAQVRALARALTPRSRVHGMPPMLGSARAAGAVRPQRHCGAMPSRRAVAAEGSGYLPTDAL